MNAGVVWESLNQYGPSTIDNIVKATGLRRELVYAALGWLGREDKIVMEIRGRAMVFSLREAQARWEAFRATEARKVKAPTLALEAVKKALVYILSEFEANREPTPGQVSKALGMDSRQLGKALSKLDIKSKSTHRGGKSVKIYSLASKARVWELAALDTEGLQKMSEGRGKATEDDREHFTVFD